MDNQELSLPDNNDEFPAQFEITYLYANIMIICVLCSTLGVDVKVMGNRISEEKLLTDKCRVG